ncbi:hypothetical protein AAFO92_07180 [Roseovarius sp. CAU 1744]|uniref:hypothetical protein n=1 Tax=Roseovarius sp. CAU 1744 TaxID=3140368 RepID=UPI00325B4DAE
MRSIFAKFSLRRRRENPTAGPAEAGLPAAPIAEKSGWKFPMSLITPRQERGGQFDMKSETNMAENAENAAIAADAPTRGFTLYLPFFRRKTADNAEAEDAAKATVIRAPRKKDAFQSAKLHLQGEEEAPEGVSAKIQLLVARLATLDRKPKALANRPDPFDRLAADAQRRSAR